LRLLNRLLLLLLFDIVIINVTNLAFFLIEIFIEEEIEPESIEEVSNKMCHTDEIIISFIEKAPFLRD
jgi:hypothetical protein